MASFIALFTFYDLLGYFIPGAVTLAGLALLVSAFYPELPSIIPASTGGHVAFFAASYIMGHVIQAVVAGQGWPVRRSLAIRASTADLDKNVLRAARRIVERKLRKELESPEGGQEEGGGDDLQDDTKFLELVDDLQIAADDRLRQIYIARQGFNRGMCIALFLVAAGALTALISLRLCWFVSDWPWVSCRSEPAITALGYPLGGHVLLAGLVIAVVGTRQSLVRYRRFVLYELRHSLAAIVRTEAGLPGAKPEATPGAKAAAAE